MASVLPRKPQDKIQFCVARVPVWTAEASNIGTTAGAVSDLSTKTDAAVAALAAHTAAQAAARAATSAYYQAVMAMGDAASDIIKSIKTKAATAGPSIYDLAQIPAPATPGPIGPLAKADNFKVTLSETGALELSWKCAQPPGATGATYNVWRRVGGEPGDFVYLGGTGIKEFVDDTLPAGSSSVTYRVQAVRSTSVGPIAQFTVSFGVSGSTMTAMVVEGAAAKIAA